MARMNEIVKENREFYCDSYIRSINRKIYKINARYILVMSILIYFINEFIRKFLYFQEASIIGTAGRDVTDYIDAKMGKGLMRFFNPYMFIILGGAVMLFLCKYYYSKHLKNYDFYKKRIRITIGPSLIILTEFILIGSFIIGEFENINIIPSLFVLIWLVSMFSLLSFSRMFMTLELRRADSSTDPLSFALNILECVVNNILEKL